MIFNLQEDVIELNSLAEGRVHQRWQNAFSVTIYLLNTKKVNL